jgi:hypothetical protein
VGELLTVRVTYRSATTVPLVGPLLPDPELAGRACLLTGIALEGLAAAWMRRIVRVQP